MPHSPTEPSTALPESPPGDATAGAHSLVGSANGCVCGTMKACSTTNSYEHLLNAS
ncbi:MAG: hypothetical protein V7646_3326 [Pseudonocardia sp.]|jgi:hypothetical protein